MAKDPTRMWTFFEYQYRDAGNFKARGAIALEGVADPDDWKRALATLEDDLFIAEQLDIPPLYAKLYQWSGEPSATDHSWHEFVALKIVEGSEIDRRTPRAGTAAAFVRRLAAVTEWQGALSPHFAL